MTWNLPTTASNLRGDGVGARRVTRCRNDKSLNNFFAFSVLNGILTTTRGTDGLGVFVWKIDAAVTYPSNLLGWHTDHQSIVGHIARYYRASPDETVLA
jgi:hypothetical protein